jgi:hypothetical protein
MRFDLMNRIAPSRAISPVSVADNTAQVSQIFDTRGMMAIALLILTGAIADADATFTVLIEEGDEADLSDAAAVADAQLLGTEALAGFQFDSDNSARKIGYIGGRRYLRATITPANNAGAALIAAVWLGTPEDQPAPNPPV